MKAVEKMNGRISKALRKLTSDRQEYKFLKKVYKTQKFTVKKPTKNSKDKA